MHHPISGEASVDAAAGSDTTTRDGDALRDATMDVALDVAKDDAMDAGTDATMDALTDDATDDALDAATDAMTDDAMDAALDAAPADASPEDAATDATPVVDADAGGPTPVRQVVLGPGVGAADPSRVDGAPPAWDPASAPTIDYPLQGAVMPSNVYPPEVMWTPHHASPAATDLYRVRLARPHVVVDGYFANASGFANAWQLPAAAWSALALADPGTPITLTVAVLSGGALHQSAALTFLTVDAVVGGSVYYWSPTAQQLERLDVATTSVVGFLPHPGNQCIGCHAVSRDGQHLTAQIELSNTHSPTLDAYDLLRDLTADPAPTLFETRARGDSALSYNNDGTRLVSAGVGQDPATARALQIMDAATGAVLRTATDPSASGIDPEWSPDGASVAYTTAQDNLYVAPVLTGDRFDTPVLVHDASTLAGGSIDWHPTWTPDSRWLAFQHGATRTSATDVHAGQPGALYLIARAGGAPVRLDRLNGGASENDSYRPLFSPFDSGGYYWLLFTSTRGYGNASAGVHGQNQVWVAAIHDRPDGASDPSEVPYYLAGQEATTVLSPFWAAAPCRANGGACAADGQCCSGDCAAGSGGAAVCASPIAACRSRGESCGGAGDCCGGLLCTNAHLCDLPPQG